MKQLAAICLLVIPLAADAIPVTYTFEGYAAGCWYYDTSGLCGSYMSGWLTVDDEPIQSTETRALYTAPSNLPGGIVVRTVAGTLWSSGISIEIQNDNDCVLSAPCDYVRMDAVFGPNGEFGTLRSYSLLDVNTINRTALSAYALSQSGDCNLAPKSCQLGRSSFETIGWTFTKSQRVIPVVPGLIPEPGSVILLFTGILLALVARRRMAVRRQYGDVQTKSPLSVRFWH